MAGIPHTHSRLRTVVQTLGCRVLQTLFLILCSEYRCSFLIPRVRRLYFKFNFFFILRVCGTICLGGRTGWLFFPTCVIRCLLSWLRYRSSLGGCTWLVGCIRGVQRYTPNRQQVVAMQCSFSVPVRFFVDNVHGYIRVRLSFNDVSILVLPVRKLVLCLEGKNPN